MRIGNEPKYDIRLVSDRFMTCLELNRHPVVPGCLLKRAATCDVCLRHEVSGSSTSGCGSHGASIEPKPSTLADSHTACQKMPACRSLARHTLAWHTTGFVICIGLGQDLPSAVHVRDWVDTQGLMGSCTYARRSKSTCNVSC